MYLSSFFRIAVKAIHRRRRSFVQNYFDGHASRFQNFIYQLHLRFAKRREHILRSIAHFLFRPDSQPDSQELLRSQRADNRLHPVVSRRTTPLPDANLPQRKIQLVVNDDQILRRIGLILLEQFPHSHAAQVHVGLWLRQQNLLLLHYGAGSERSAIPVSDFHAGVVRQAINRQKAQVVGRELVFDSRIAQANDQFHEYWLLAPGSQLVVTSRRRRGREPCDRAGTDLPTTNNQPLFLFLLLRLVGSSFLAALFLGLLLALLDDLGFGGRGRGLGSHRFGGRRDFFLDRNNVGYRLIGIGENLQLLVVRKIGNAQDLSENQVRDFRLNLAGNVAGHTLDFDFAR